MPTLTGTSASASGTNVGATKQPGEPDHAGDPGGQSVWYRWQAPLSERVFIDVCDNDFSTLLAVYTGGGSVGSLHEVASSNAFTTGNCSVDFVASAGTTYRIAVDGSASAPGFNTGTFTLALTQATISVTTTDDELNNGDGDCSLREAVQAANTNAAVDGCDAGVAGADVIGLPGGTYRLQGDSDEDANQTGDLDVTESVTLKGGGSQPNS